MRYARVLLVVAGIYATFSLGVVVHEYGHAVACALIGARTDDSGARFQLRTDQWLPVLDGSYSCRGAASVPEARLGILLVAGGASMMLMLAGIQQLAIRAFPDPYAPLSAVATPCLMLLVVATEFVPGAIGASTNDGQFFLEIYGGSASALLILLGSAACVPSFVVGIREWRRPWREWFV